MATKNRTQKSTAPAQAALLEKDPTDKHEAFAAYVQEQTGHEAFDARAAQLAYVLMSKFQKSDQNQRLIAEAKAAREQAEVTREENRAARAEKAAQKAAKPTAEKSTAKASSTKAASGKTSTKASGGTTKATAPRKRGAKAGSTPAAF